MSNTPFDEKIKNSRAPWDEFFKDAAIHVCEAFDNACKILRQELKLDPDDPISLEAAIELTRLQLLENQRLSQAERRRWEQERADDQ